MAGRHHRADPTTDPDLDVEPTEAGRHTRFRIPPPTRTQLVALVLALMFLGGSVGHIIGAGRPPGRDSVDVGFAQDMSAHHDQAVTMASIVIDKATEPLVRSFARETLVSQRYEIGLMGAWLGEWGYGTDPDRVTAMGWMGMPVPVAEMPGMASQVQLDQLAGAEGRQIDSLYLAMMTEHHRGGVQMATVAAKKASDSRVRALAAAIARSQRIEINEMEAARQRLGL